MNKTSPVLKRLEDKGYEFHYFKIGWYNDQVSDLFKFTLPYDTLAAVIISTPSMFERSFLPCVKTAEYSERDPIDECTRREMMAVKEEDIEVLYDYELNHNRRPKVLVQTAGHVSGAVTYIQRADIKHDPWPPDKKIFGACVHPRYCGWFALRAVLIFKSILVPDLPRFEPPDILNTDAQRIDFLERFNFHWQDWTFRDVFEPLERYSDLQKLYFETVPKQRQELVKRWIDTGVV